MKKDNRHDFLLKPSFGRPKRGFVWNDTYEFGIYAMYGCSTDQFRAELVSVAPRYEMDDGIFVPKLGARLVWDSKLDGRIYIAFSQSRPSVRHISHEAVHAAITLLNSRGVDTSNENDESLAYLTGWCAQKLHDMSRG